MGDDSGSGGRTTALPCAQFPLVRRRHARRWQRGLKALLDGVGVARSATHYQRGVFSGCASPVILKVRCSVQADPYAVTRPGLCLRILYVKGRRGATVYCGAVTSDIQPCLWME